MGRHYLEEHLAKSEKARKSAGSRWGDANAMLLWNANAMLRWNTNVIRPNYERNTTLVYEGITTNTNIVKKKTARKLFIAPEPQEAKGYARSIGFELDGEANRLKKRRPAETGQ